jgi:putative ABC transport system substrate-binding protein
VARLPTIWSQQELVEAGRSCPYGANFIDLFRRAHDLVDQDFVRGKPGGIPVELPTRYELVINLETAKRLGLTMPSTLMARADEVIE